MAAAPSLSFSKTLEADAPVVVILVDPDNRAGAIGSALIGQLTEGFERAVAATGFSGKPGSFLDILAPAGLSAGRLILAGVGAAAEFDDKAALKLGGQVFGKLKELKVKAATVVLESSGGPLSPELGAEFAHRLRDPFEAPYMGVLRTNDPLLLERGQGAVALYRDLRRDGKVFAGLQKRQLALVGKAWQVSPREEDNSQASQDALVVTQILKGFAFDQLCAELLSALLAGWAVAEVVWTVRDGLVVPERVVARIDGEITVKLLRQTREAIRLLPRNPDYPPIEVLPGQDFAIEGLYCGLVRPSR